jgi:hypothetical protein
MGFKGYWRYSSEEGSVTVLFALLIPIMLLMVMLTANIGQLVFEKIRLQNVADACALAAATVQAAGLNEIADLNEELEDEYNKLKYILDAHPTLWHNDEHPRNAIRFFNDIFKYIHALQSKADIDYVKKAGEIAVAVFRQNMPQGGGRIEVAFPSNRLVSAAKPQWKRRTVRFMYIAGSCSEPCPQMPTKTWNESFAGRRDRPYVYRYRGIDRSKGGIMRPGWDSGSLNVKMIRTSPTWSRIELTQDIKSFIIGGTLFGQIPRLKVVAQAKPAGGSIRDGLPQYRPLLIPVQD